jgi:Alginate export
VSMRCCLPESSLYICVFSLSCGVILSVALAAQTVQAQKRRPFSEQDIVRLLRGDVTPGRVTELVRERGIDFRVTPEIETELRKAGADDALLALLRKVAPNTSAQATPKLAVERSAEPAPEPDPDQGQQEATQRPPYLDLVYDEDWSFLKDFKGPPDFFDPIKYIPLNDRGWYISLGGEIRQRWDNWHNAEFGYAPAATLNDNLQRYLFDVDAHLGEHVRVFTQLQSALEFGKKGGPWYTDKNVFDLHQAFVDFQTSANPKHYTRLRVGRQEFALGTDHFVSTADFFNVRRAFDGARLDIGRGSWSWMFEATKPVLIKPGTFDDEPTHGTTSWTAALYAPNPFTKQGRFVAFYAGLDTKHQLWQRGLGHDLRHTLAVHIEGSQKGLDYTYEGLLQLGTFTPVQGPSAGIRAWGITSDTGFTLGKSKHYPRIGVRSDITSGDSGHGSLGTFDPLFPDTAYSGKLGLVGPSNIIDLTPNFRAALTKRIYFLSDWSFFWRENTHDAIYTPALLTTTVNSGVTGYIAFPALPGDGGRFVGNQVSVGSQLTINRHLDYTLGYSYLTAGDFLKDTPPAVPAGKSVGYLWAWLRFRF